MGGLAERARTRRRRERARGAGGTSQRRVVIAAVLLVALLAAAAVIVWLTQAGSSGGPDGEKIPGRPPILVALPDGVPQGSAAARARALTSYVAHHGTDGDALIALAGAEAELGRMTQAEAALEAAGHLGGSNAVRAGAALTLLRYTSLGEERAIAGLGRFASERPKDPFVRLALGLAELYAGRASAARAAFSTTLALDPDGYYGSSADDVLHPEQRPGYPEFVLDSKTAYATDAAALEAAEAHPTDPGVLLAAAAQLQGTSRREALRLAQQAQTVEGNGDALDAQVAVAILGYAKDDPAAAAGQLGPLAAAHPDSALARFHFGLLLFWFNRPADAHGQFVRAASAERGTKLAQLARAFADGTAGSGTPSTIVPRTTAG